MHLILTRHRLRHTLRVHLHVRVELVLGRVANHCLVVDPSHACKVSTCQLGLYHVLLVLLDVLAPLATDLATCMRVVALLVASELLAVKFGPKLLTGCFHTFVGLHLVHARLAARAINGRVFLEAI